MSNAFTVHLVKWHDCEPLLRTIREKVFIQEQQVPVELEWDGLDEKCEHALALAENGSAIGCGRITPEGHIGRISVLPEWRRKHVGSAILELLIDNARAKHFPKVELNAQIQALPFYKQAGFNEEGDTFLDANIPHRKMLLHLKDRTASFQ